MSPSLKIFIAALSLLSLLACAPKIDGDADDLNRQIEQIKRDNADRQRKLDADLARARADQSAKAIKDLEDSMTRMRDSNAAGSQPGTIFLIGAVSTSAVITTESTVGIGWRGTAKPLGASALVKKTAYNPKEIAPDGTYINLGCTDLREARGLKEVKPKYEDKGATFSAEVVFLCDAQMKFEKPVLIRASKLLLSNVSIAISGVSFLDQLSIVADELELRGVSSISSRADDGAITMFASPQVTLASEKLIATGSLSITSRGASYVATPAASPVTQ